MRLVATCRVGLMIVSLIFPSYLHAQADRLTAVQALEDVRYLIDALESTHPDPYTAFGGPAGFQRRAQQLQAAIPADGMTIDSLYAVSRRFVSRLGDLHTSIQNDSRQESQVIQMYLPVRFKVACDGLFISAAKESFRALLGSRLMAAGGVSIDSLRFLMNEIAVSENDYGTLRRLSFQLRYRTRLAELFGDTATAATVRLTTAMGREFDTTIELWSRERYMEAPWHEADNTLAGTGEGLISAGYLDGDPTVGYLWYAAMTTREAFQIARANKSASLEGSLDGVYENHLKTERPADLDDAIAAVPSLVEVAGDLLREMLFNQSEYLVIDLRRNGGGWTQSMIPLLYMLYGDRYFETDFPVQWTYRVSQNYLNKFEMTIDEFNAEQGTTLETGDYYFEPRDSLTDGVARRERYLKHLRDDGLEFGPALESLNGQPICTPKVIVVVSTQTGSSAFHLLYYLQALGATVVGVPPAQAANAFMDITPLVLPNSHLKLNVAHSALTLFPDDPELGRTLYPDYCMSVADFAAYGFGPDAELMKVVELIRGGELSE